MATECLSGSVLVMLSQRIENIERFIASGNKDKSDESSLGLVLGVYVPQANLKNASHLRFLNTDQYPVVR